MSPASDVGMRVNSPLEPERPGAAISRGFVRILRSAQELESVRRFWSCSAGSRDSDIDVFLTALRSDPAIRRPHVLVFEHDGKPAALLVGRIVRRPLSFKIGYLSIFNSLANVMTFPYGSLRGDLSSEDCEQLISTVVSGLASGEADVAILEYLDSESQLYKWAKRRPGVLSRDHFPTHRFHRKRQLPASVDRLYASFSAHERKRFRQIQRKLNNDFSSRIRIERLQSAADLDRALRVVEEISKKTWQGKMGRGLSADGPLSSLFQLEAQKSWLQIYTLYIEDRPSAFWMGAVYQATFYSDFVGFDPAYAQYSPGMYLLCRMMEDFCTEGVEAIDFGFSDEEYKKRFGNVEWQEASLHIFAPNLKGLTLTAMSAIAFLLREPARAVLARTNLIQRAKKMFRKVTTKKQAETTRPIE